MYRSLVVAYTLPLCLLIGCTAAPRFVSDRSRPASESGGYQLSGIASYYSDEFNGRTTASGETFDMNDLTAAHRTLPFNTLVRVRNLLNGLEVIVRVNDRGPFKDDRVIDLSLEAAKRVDLIPFGTAPVSLEVVELGRSPSR